MRRPWFYDAAASLLGGVTEGILRALANGAGHGANGLPGVSPAEQVAAFCRELN